MRYMDLTVMQMLEVLRQTDAAYLALSADGQPYIVPMHYSLDADGLTPIVRMKSDAACLKMEILAQNDRVCMAFSLMNCAWLDTVTVFGRAAIGTGEAGLPVTISVRGEQMSGRRYFL